MDQKMKYSLISVVNHIKIINSFLLLFFLFSCNTIQRTNVHPIQRLENYNKNKGRTLEVSVSHGSMLYMVPMQAEDTRGIRYQLLYVNNYW
jgi:hypothetical protein